MTDETGDDKTAGVTTIPISGLSGKGAAEMSSRLQEGPAITRRTFLGGSGALVVETLLSKRAFGQEASPVVKTSAGKVRGLRALGILSFRGIPYGGGVSGAGRFMPPGAAKPWAGIREGTQAGPRAIQAPGSLFENSDVGPYFCGGRKDCLSITNQADSEECLDLNVLTPGPPVDVPSWCISMEADSPEVPRPSPYWLIALWLRTIWFSLGSIIA